MLVPFLVAAAAVALIFWAGTADSAEACCHCCCATEENVGSKLSYDELLQLAQDVGFGCDANIAAAIALAESDGDPQAYNPETQACTPEGEGSYGLWQIYHKKHHEYPAEQLYDPRNNAREAFMVYAQAGNSFHPWSTFKSGKYQEYLA